MGSDTFNNTIRDIEEEQGIKSPEKIKGKSDYYNKQKVGQWGQRNAGDIHQTVGSSLIAQGLRRGHESLNEFGYGSRQTGKTKDHVGDLKTATVFAGHSLDNNQFSKTKITGAYRGTDGSIHLRSEITKENMTELLPMDIGDFKKGDEEYNQAHDRANETIKGLNKIADEGVVLTKQEQDLVIGEDGKINPKFEEALNDGANFEEALAHVKEAQAGVDALKEKTKEADRQKKADRLKDSGKDEKGHLKNNPSNKTEKDLENDRKKEEAKRTKAEMKAREERLKALAEAKKRAEDAKKNNKDDDDDDDEDDEDADETSGSSPNQCGWNPLDPFDDDEEKEKSSSSSSPRALAGSSGKRSNLRLIIEKELRKILNEGSY